MFRQLQNNFYPHHQRGHPNNNNISSLLVNSLLLGTCHSKFDSCKKIKAFGWELTSREMKMITTSAFSRPIKDVEFQTDALFTAKFSMKMIQNQYAVMEAAIKRNNVKIPVNAKYYFVINGRTMIEGNFISRQNLVNLQQHNGSLEMVIEFTEINDV
uniref:Uncharacterized protein n=1 Tax=Panagrolaimus sp. PS1159 TaxID=55785 RepID=A0AC35F6A2_9BILA